MKQNHKRIIVALCIAGILLLVRVFSLPELLTIETFRQYRDQLLSITSEYYILTVTFFMAFYMVVVALSIPGATLLTLIAGFLFGFIGVIYVNIGAVIGALVAFLVARYLIGDWIQKRYREPFASFNKEIAENGYSYLLALRFIPLFPFVLINIFAGITRVAPMTFVWTTMVGILPASVVYVYTGRQLGSIDQPGAILSWQIVLAFVLLGLLALSPVLIKKVMKKKKSETPYSQQKN